METVGVIFDYSVTKFCWLFCNFSGSVLFHPLSHCFVCLLSSFSWVLSFNWSLHLSPCCFPLQFLHIYQVPIRRLYAVIFPTYRWSSSLLSEILYYDIRVSGPSIACPPLVPWLPWDPCLKTCILVRFSYYFFPNTQWYSWQCLCLCCFIYFYVSTQSLFPF